MLPAEITLYRADIHEVIPASKSEARHIHFVEVPGRVLQLPVLVVSRMAEHLADEVKSCLRTSSLLEAHHSGGAASTITQMEKALAGIRHVLSDQVWRL